MIDTYSGIQINKNQFGIEIGPSYNPKVPKKDGWNVVVVDHANSEQLRSKYIHADVDISMIEEVDVIWRGGSLAEVIRQKYPDQVFDYIIASHVVEHLPNLVDFLQNCEMLLAETGILLLTVPDKRFTFDYFKPLSSSVDLLSAYIKNDQVHPLSTALTDFFLGVSNMNRLSWGKEEKINFEEFLFFIPLSQAYNDWKDYSETEYVDFHRWFFTEHSFKLAIKDLLYLKLINLDITSLISDPTRADFVVCLSKAESTISLDNYSEERLEYLREVQMDLFNQINQCLLPINPEESEPIENLPLTSNVQRILYRWVDKLIVLLRWFRVRLIPVNSPLYHRLIKTFTPKND